MTHPLCLAHLSVQELSPPQVVEVAAQAGFPLVSLRLAPAADGERQHPMLGGTPMMAETRARLRDLGVAVHDVELVRLTARTDVDALQPLLAAAAELGARQVLVAGDEPCSDALAQRFADLCALGSRHGLRMGVEFMPWRGINNLAAARSLVDFVGAGGVVVDAIHLDRSGGTAADLQQLPLGQWAWFQICDAPRQRPATRDELLFQARQARRPPGQGGLDLEGMVRALPPGCVVSVEAPLHGLPDLLPPAKRARLLRHATLQVLEKAQPDA
ncbi:sugar phosphate isomerase/epimerase family protein [Ramlibacter sp. Leaf400]|uniref:sugar phosphate isomerase/epimerase family protein n=1 Tax=Ramlibacter sp. Leaf400 TaxID=1736365 RepID=UPI0006FCB4C8|nr:TIM barrel protein [Ramlibacter sp. Leaf400]KQT11601.1 hypothetical protein ASG30_06970 [Ramlibacter sp. Leaf400]